MKIILEIGNQPLNVECRWLYYANNCFHSYFLNRVNVEFKQVTYETFQILISIISIQNVSVLIQIHILWI